MDEPRTLGAGAISYVRQRLEQGSQLRTLSRLLLQHLDLEAGEASAFLPRETPATDANNPEYGLVTDPGRKVETESGTIWVAAAPSGQPVYRLVRAFLRSNEDAYCLIEDPMPRPEEVSDEPDCYLFYEDEVYLYLTHRDQTLEYIRDVMWLPPIWDLTAALTIVPTASGYVGPRRRLTRAQLEEFAVGVRRLVLGAWDGDAFLIWDRWQGSAQH